MDAEAFRDEVYRHYREHGRDLPWRRTRDPWAILVSEVMLQQTQVPRVAEKYPAFLAAFPRPEALAAAPLEAVLREWQGLGYNRRALNLKRCAEAVVAEHGGRLPGDYEALKRLPGIGPATAAAVCAMAFGIPVPYIETNIRAVYLHFFFADTCDVPDREILAVVAETLDRDDPRSWYYALMDYGVKLKKELPNPCRRSRHHTRQTAFEGSRRQLRGRVLREVLASGEATAPGLAEVLGADENEVASVLEALAAEGLLAREGSRYSVP